MARYRTAVVRLSAIERLEPRCLLSASGYPVIVNDAAVIADNQHLTHDKTQLSADSASFKALVADDKSALQTTVAADRSAVKAAQAAVKADADNPTLLAPAQATLENATIKLSGDTAALKTRLTVDTADKKAALGIDNLAMREDQADLKTDTQAAEVALGIGVKRIARDLAAIEAGGPASTGVAAALDADLTAAARGQARPAAAAVSACALALETALNGGGLSAAQETALGQDLADVVNSGGVSADLTQGVISAAGDLISAGGASAGNTQAAVAAIEGMIVG